MQPTSLSAKQSTHPAGRRSPVQAKPSHTPTTNANPSVQVSLLHDLLDDNLGNSPRDDLDNDLDDDLSNELPQGPSRAPSPNQPHQNRIALLVHVVHASRGWWSRLPGNQHSLTGSFAVIVIVIVLESAAGSRVCASARIGSSATGEAINRTRFGAVTRARARTTVRAIAGIQYHGRL
jgi:hypothetical protein